MYNTNDREKERKKIVYIQCHESFIENMSLDDDKRRKENFQKIPNFILYDDGDNEYRIRVVGHHTREAASSLDFN